MIAHSVPAHSPVILILAKTPHKRPGDQHKRYEETCASVPAVLDFWNQKLDPFSHAGKSAPIA